jgi:ribosomal protein S8E
VVYNASNNELVRTNTLVKSAIVQIDATPFRQWYEQHYGINLGKTKTAKADVHISSINLPALQVVLTFSCSPNLCLAQEGQGRQEGHQEGGQEDQEGGPQEGG